MRDKPELKLRGDGLGFGGLNRLPQRLKQRKAGGVVLLRLASLRWMVRSGLGSSSSAPPGGWLVSSIRA